MLTIDPERSLFLVIDFQARLMPAIYEGDVAIRNASKLSDIAKLLDIPRLFTEQNPKGLGTTVPELSVEEERVVPKFSFDACRAETLLDHIRADAHVIVAGCEAHVCVLQTVLGLLSASRKLFVVQDAIGSRKPEDKAAAVRRMDRHGAEIVTSEMVAFEWLQSAEHPSFRQAMALIK